MFDKSARRKILIRYDKWLLSPVRINAISYSSTNPHLCLYLLSHTHSRRYPEKVCLRSDSRLHFQFEKETGKDFGKEQRTPGEEEEDEDEEPLPETFSGASQLQNSAILDDFINGASLQVTERNGEASLLIQTCSILLSSSCKAKMLGTFLFVLEQLRDRACDSCRRELKLIVL